MENYSLRVIGVDPGLEITGVGILDVKGSQYIPVYCNCIITKKSIPINLRLKQIYDSLNSLIKKFCPSCFAIEDIFFSSNVKTALSVGQASGVSILAGTNNNLKIYKYSPLQVKQAVVGYGRASKKQIKYMLKMILSTTDDFFPNNDDAWDAMGIAVCHASMSKFESKISAFIK